MIRPWQNVSSVRDFCISVSVMRLKEGQDTVPCPKVKGEGYDQRSYRKNR